MKRRIIKKNINRFITPLINGLPKIQTYGAIEDVELSKDRLFMRYVYDRQHIIVNGKRKDQSEISIQCDNVLLNIRRTSRCIRNILEQFNHVYLRVAPEVRGRRVYVRLISE